MGKYTSFLKETDLFYNLTPAQLDRIETICEQQDFEKGALIFTESSREDELYLILRGEVEILIDPGLVMQRGEAASQPSIVSILRRGQSFGEIALVDQGVRSASARAAQKATRLLRIERTKFLQLCDENPDLGYRVLLNLAADLAQKIRTTDLRVREALLYQQKARPTAHRTEEN